MFVSVAVGSHLGVLVPQASLSLSTSWKRCKRTVCYCQKVEVDITFSMRLSFSICNAKVCFTGLKN